MGTITFNGENVFLEELIYIQIDNSLNGTIADSLNNYELCGLEIGEIYKVTASSLTYPNQSIEIEIKRKVERLNFNLTYDCEINNERAKMDILQRDMKLYLVGSIAPLACTKKESRNAIKYGLKYFDFGCNPPPLGCIAEYNRTIVAFLQKKYGKGVLSKLRKDIIL